MMETWKATRTNLKECRAIHTRLKKSVKSKKQLDRKAFCRLMLQGQVKKALRFVDNTNDIDGKYDMTIDIIKKLKEKHPNAAEPKQSAITDKPKTKTKRVILENITRWNHIQYQKLIGVWRTNTDWHGNLERNNLFKIIWYPFTKATWRNCHLG